MHYSTIYPLVHNTLLFGDLHVVIAENNRVIRYVAYYSKQES